MNCRKIQAILYDTKIFRQIFNFNLAENVYTILLRIGKDKSSPHLYLFNLWLTRPDATFTLFFSLKGNINLY